MTLYITMRLINHREIGSNPLMFSGIYSNLISLLYVVGVYGSGKMDSERMDELRLEIIEMFESFFLVDWSSLLICFLHPLVVTLWLFTFVVGLIWRVIVSNW